MACKHPSPHSLSSLALDLLRFGGWDPIQSTAPPSWSGSREGGLGARTDCIDLWCGSTGWPLCHQNIGHLMSWSHRSLGVWLLLSLLQPPLFLVQIDHMTAVPLLWLLSHPGCLLLAECSSGSQPWDGYHDP